MWDAVRRWEAALTQAGAREARTITLYAQDVRRFLTWLVWNTRERIAQGGALPPSDHVAQRDSAERKDDGETGAEDGGDEAATQLQALSDSSLMALLAAVIPHDAQA